MAYATATASPIARSLSSSWWAISPCDRSAQARLDWEVQERPDQDICLEEGEFQVSLKARGLRRIGRFTGRTRKIAGQPCPTVELFDVATVVEYVGELPVIVGRRGDRLDGGTWYTSANAVA